MAITGHFLADFDDFYRAVTQAETHLKSFASGSANVEKSLNRMVDSFSGRRVVQEATLMVEAVERVGGVSKLTAAELATVSSKASDAVLKLKAMGQDVPPGLQKVADQAKAVATQTGAMGTSFSGLVGPITAVAGAFGLAFSVQAVTRFIGSVIEAGGAIQDMSTRLGISTDAVQGFKYAAEQSGSSLDAVGGAMTRMSVNVAEGSKDTVRALAAIGLTVAELRAMAPEDAFLAIADGIKEIPDPMQQTEVALQLFGKGAAELLPAIKAGFRDVADSSTKMSKDMIANMDAAGDAWVRLKTEVLVGAGAVISKLADISTHFTTTAVDFVRWRDKFGLPPGLIELANLAGELPKSLDAATEAADRMAVKFREAGALKPISMTPAEIKQIEDALTATATAAINAAKFVADTEIAYAKLIRETVNLQQKALMDADAAAMAHAKASAAANAEGLRLMEIDYLTFSDNVEKEAASARETELAVWMKSVNDGVLIVGEGVNKVEGQLTASIARTNAAVSSAVTSWSHAMQQVQSGMGTLSGTVQQGGMFQASREQIQRSFEMRRYSGPVTPYGTPDWARLGFMASGGSVAAGRPYLVGEAGPELFMSKSAGTIVPNRALGGAVVNVAVDARDSFYDTPAGVAKLADKVGRAVMTSMRQKGWNA